MREGFLQKAAQASRYNVREWMRRFPDPPSPGHGRRPLFLPHDRPGCGIIAEVKRKSPSRGDLMGDADPLRFPSLYAAAGAEAVSVVVEERYFGGSPELFASVAALTDLPLLWKDFVLDPYQVRLAAALGASAVLIIAGMQGDDEMAGLLAAARNEGLRPLVEVHNEGELDRALAAGADLIGINNRDLVTLEVDTGASERMAGILPAHVQGVAESGIRGPRDVALMASLGFRAVLVGESLVTAGDPEGLLAQMAAAGKKTVRVQKG